MTLAAQITGSFVSIDRVDFAQVAFWRLDHFSGEYLFKNNALALPFVGGFELFPAR